MLPTCAEEENPTGQPAIRNQRVTCLSVQHPGLSSLIRLASLGRSSAWTESVTPDLVFQGSSHLQICATHRALWERNQQIRGSDPAQCWGGRDAGLLRGLPKVVALKALPP